MDSRDSVPTESGESAMKPDRRSSGWIKRVPIGTNPPERALCATRMGALEKSIRGSAERDGEEVIKPDLGTTFDLLTEAYDFYNLYLWKHGFGIRYGNNRLNQKRKMIQEIVCGCSARY